MSVPATGRRLGRPLGLAVERREDRLDEAEVVDQQSLVPTKKSRFSATSRL